MGHTEPIEIIIIQVSQITGNLWYLCKIMKTTVFIRLSAHAYFSLLEGERPAEQQEREGEKMANTLRSALIGVCGKTADCRHPFYRKFPQPLPTPCG